MKLMTVIISVLFTWPVAAAPVLGTETGNAGDAYVAEFVLSARDIVQRLELLVREGRPIYDTAPLRAAIATTEVVSKERVYLNGLERDAVNYPSRRLIEISRLRWNDYRRSIQTKDRMRLVLHEFLWVSGVDDTNFVHSERLIEIINPANYSPNIWWNPVNPLNYVAPKLEYAPEDCVFHGGKLDVKSQDETLVMESLGNCGEAYRKLEIIKTTGVTPVSSNVRGLFHKYDLRVFDRRGTVVGQVGFEPEWGECLLPEDGSCRVSGKLTLGGVEFVFWFLRD